jgi:hypothetical protein
MINLNDTTPSAPSGGVNLKWQQDGSGNVSAYASLGINKVTVTPAAGVVTMDCSVASSFLVTINANITSVVISGAVDGQEITILWSEDSTGGWTIALPANLLGATAPSTGANTQSCQKFTYNVGDTNFYAIAAGVTGM